MRLRVELFDVYFGRGNERSWLSLFEVNYVSSLLYIEWGQGAKIQISFLFGIIKNY